MKRHNRLLILLTLSSILLAPHANALGKNTNSNSSSGISSVMQDFLLNLGIAYAKTNPKISPVLTALGINSAADIKNLVTGDSNGSNIRDIIVNGALQYAMQNPQFLAFLQKYGIADFANLKKLLSSGDPVQVEWITNHAFAYLNSNPNYQVWLSQLGINDASDLIALVNGTGQSTDLKSIILTFAMIYAQANPQYGIYIMLISTLLNSSSSGTVVNIEDPFLGSFEGLNLSEISAIMRAKKLNLN